jgi:N-acetylmuramoyl-L-alanine amidase
VRLLLSLALLLALSGDAAARDACTPQEPVAVLQPGDLSRMARVVISEARGEPFIGQVAIAETILNRLNEPKLYGSTIKAILGRPQQFAPPAPRAETDPVYLRALFAVLFALLDVRPDITSGATHFHKIRVHPDWADDLTLTVRIGSHLFYSQEAD